MCVFPSEGNLPMCYRHGTRVYDVVRRRMHHHRCARIRKRTRLDQVDLAPKLLFRGRAKNGQSDTQFLGYRNQRRTGSQGGGCDDVVSTSLSYTWKSVVFGTDDDLGTGGPHPGGESGVETVGRVFHLETRPHQKFDKPSRCRSFLEGGLRVVVHPTVEFSQFLLHIREALCGQLLGVQIEPPSREMYVVNLETKTSLGRRVARSLLVVNPP